MKPELAKELLNIKFRESFTCPVCGDVYKPHQEDFSDGEIAYCITENNIITYCLECKCKPYFWELTYDTITGKIIKTTIGVHIS